MNSSSSLSSNDCYHGTVMSLLCNSPQKIFLIQCIVLSVEFLIDTINKLYNSACNHDTCQNFLYNIIYMIINYRLYIYFFTSLFLYCIML